MDYEQFFSLFEATFRDIGFFGDCDSYTRVPTSLINDECSVFSIGANTCGDWKYFGIEIFKTSLVVFSYNISYSLSWTETKENSKLIDKFRNK